jgi:hypothetical protein
MAGFFHSQFVGSTGCAVHHAKRDSPSKSLFSSKQKAAPVLRPFFTTASFAAPQPMLHHPGTAC